MMMTMMVMMMIIRIARIGESFVDITQLPDAPWASSDELSAWNDGYEDHHDDDPQNDDHNDHDDDINPAKCPNNPWVFSLWSGQWLLSTAGKYPSLQGQYLVTRGVTDGPCLMDRELPTYPGWHPKLSHQKTPKYLLKAPDFTNYTKNCTLVTMLTLTRILFTI